MEGRIFHLHDQFGRLLRLSVVGVLLCGGSQVVAQSVIVDRQSSIPFSVTIAQPGGGAPHRLTGTATRERTIFRVKVYAYGLYVDAQGARAALPAFVGKPATALQADLTFFQRLLEMRIPMTLRLIMARDVAGEAIGAAFDDALRPRVARVAQSRRESASDALELFRSYFNLNELARETEIVFSCANGRLNTTVHGQSKPEIQSPELCWALFDVYLGERSISPTGRRQLVTGFPTLLADPR